MEQIKNFFKFLEDKEGITPPLKYKLLHDPKSITPEDLNVKGDLSWAHPQLPSIPDNLTVEGNLNLNYSKFIKLPDNLTVGGNLHLNFSKFSSIPNNLKIGGNLWVVDTPITKLYSGREIRKMIEDKGGIMNEKIFT
jgi:hypothetical protein